jgi:hypothetical protein
VSIQRGNKSITDDKLCDKFTNRRNTGTNHCRINAWHVVIVGTIFVFVVYLISLRGLRFAKG